MENKQNKIYQDQFTKCRQYASVFSGEDGEAVLKDLEEYSQMNGICFNENPRTEAFMLGARSVALYIHDRINGKTLDRLRIKKPNGVEGKELTIKN